MKNIRRDFKLIQENNKKNHFNPHFSIFRQFFYSLFACCNNSFLNQHLRKSKRFSHFLLDFFLIEDIYYTKTQIKLDNTLNLTEN